MTRMKLDILAWMIAVAFFAFAIVPASADEDINGQPAELVDKAVITLENFVTDPAQYTFRKHLKTSKGIFIVPMLLKGGFIFGASGGNGVFLGRDEQTGEWSYPAFYTMGSVNFGPQIGAQMAEVVLLMRTVHDVDTLLATTLKMGLEINIATGLAGGGGGVKTANILLFTRTKGAFVGVTLEGSIIEAKDEWNRAYYGKPTHPTDILVRRNVSSEQAEALRTALTKTIRELSASETGETNIPSPATAP